MPKGISIHIGLNRVDPAEYAGWEGALNACEADARAMQAIAEAQGYRSALVLTADATHARVRSAVREAAAELRSGDILLLTYSGHGGQVDDTNGDEPEDETWVLYDRELVDDELYAEFGRFRAGVRIVVLSDSCHSGTVTRTYERLVVNPDSRRVAAPSGPAAFRVMPRAVAERVHEAKRAELEEVQRATRGVASEPVAASILLMSGCQDSQLSLDGSANGLFTATLLAVWDGGRFRGNYRTLHRRILRRMPPTQTPNLFRVGAPDPGFLRVRPFSI
jgi:hypothetical protein